MPKVTIEHREYHKCNICNLVFDSEALHEYHLKVKRHHTCSICRKYFKVKSSLTQHVRNVHYKEMCPSEVAEAVEKTGVAPIARRNIKCPEAQCEGKTFASLNTLREHMVLQHGEEHPFATYDFPTYEGKYLHNILEYL